MKILIITAAFPPEPVVTSHLSYDISASLAVNNEVTVLCPKPTRPLGSDYRDHHFQEDQNPYKRIQLSSYASARYSLLGRFRESYSIGKSAEKYIKINHLNIDVIYINTWPLFGQYFAIRAAKTFDLPAIVHVQDIYPEALIAKIPFLKKIIFKLLLPIDKYVQQNAAKVITISDGMRSMLLKTRVLNEEKVKVVFNWQNEERFIVYHQNKKIRTPDRFFTFMFLGSLNHTAAVHILIKAFLDVDLINTRLIIAGNGPEKRNLISLTESSGNSNIEFRDAPIEKIQEIQDQADVLLLSLNKGAAQFALPSKLTAYLFSKKPVIASVDEDSDTSKIVLNANCGWVVPPENIKRLTVAMKNAAQMKQERLILLGNNGFNYALENFSRSVNLNQITAIIESLVKIEPVKSGTSI